MVSASDKIKNNQISITDLRSGLTSGQGGGQCVYIHCEFLYFNVTFLFYTDKLHYSV